MSRRPNIQSPHERTVARGIQRARRTRDATRPRTATPPASSLEPCKTCVGRGAPDHPMPKAVTTWIAGEVAQQLRRYRKNAVEMEALGPQRDAWVAEFFERITGPRGYSVHAGMRKTIATDALPVRPARHWRVVW